MLNTTQFNKTNKHNLNPIQISNSQGQNLKAKESISQLKQNIQLDFLNSISNNESTTATKSEKTEIKNNQLVATKDRIIHQLESHKAGVFGLTPFGLESKLSEQGINVKITLRENNGKNYAQVDYKLAEKANSLFFTIENNKLSHLPIDEPGLNAQSQIKSMVLRQTKAVEKEIGAKIYNNDYETFPMQNESNEQIECRHLAMSWILSESKVDFYKSISTPAEVQNNIKINDDQITKIIYESNENVHTSLNSIDLGSLINKEMDQYINSDSQSEQYKASYAVFTPTHAMAFEIKGNIDKDYVSINFYDPNSEVGHSSIRISLNNLEDDNFMKKISKKLFSGVGETTKTDVLLNLTKINKTKTPDDTIEPSCLIQLTTQERLKYNANIINDLVPFPLREEVIKSVLLPAKTQGLNLIKQEIITDCNELRNTAYSGTPTKYAIDLSKLYLVLCSDEFKDLTNTDQEFAAMGLEKLLAATKTDNWKTNGIIKEIILKLAERADNFSQSALRYFTRAITNFVKKDLLSNVDTLQILTQSEPLFKKESTFGLKRLEEIRQHIIKPGIPASAEIVVK